MKEQRRSRKIAMTPDEVDAFLASERTCRVATNGTHGPHATPLWYVWHGGALWLTSLSRSQRWADLAADPRIAAVVDAGDRAPVPPQRGRNHPHAALAPITRPDRTPAPPQRDRNHRHAALAPITRPAATAA